jgi:hypothetical protein
MDFIKKNLTASKKPASPIGVPAFMKLNARFIQLGKTMFFVFNFILRSLLTLFLHGRHSINSQLAHDESNQATPANRIRND